MGSAWSEALLLRQMLALKILFLYQSHALILPTRLRHFLAATKAGKQAQGQDKRHFAARGPFDW